MKRRDFLQQLLVAFGGGVLLSSCRQSTPKFPVRIVGANAAVGHLLRSKEPVSLPTGEAEKTDVIIIGGGISGLSAARHLAEAGKDFLLLELESQTGGNARFGKNETSAYPLGAHYIPTPNNNLTEYLKFLQEAGVITGYDAKGLPIYREEYLCFDPQERLRYNGRWQEGLIPAFGLTPLEKAELKRFLAHMEKLRFATGADGKEAFAIPVDASSEDPVFRKLDTLTMRDWLLQNSYRSEPLYWYINYCCRDDFGTPYQQCSAWAGIHYFAARKGQGSNANHADVLTWPEGNGFLAKALRKNSATHIRCNALALRVSVEKDGVNVVYRDVSSGENRLLQAQKVILAVPQYVAARLLGDTERQAAIRRDFSYVPWLVAQLHLRAFSREEMAALCWDNVWQHSGSLGYVHASHQLLQTEHPRINLCYYYPLTEKDAHTERQQAQRRTEADWAELILKEMEQVHPGIRQQVLEISVQLWGHSMAQVKPGQLFGGARQRWAAPLDGRIFFAHTDVAGISIFEEAFYQGLKAAKQVLGNG